MKHITTKRAIRIGSLSVLCIVTGLVLATSIGMQPLPETLAPDPTGIRYVQYLDRNNQPLNTTYANRWNYSAYSPLHDMPPMLVNAFVAAEDGRFFEHGGSDWKARMSAMVQNVRAGRIVRGASTITEQVVRMLHPRPRTFWSRWLEGWEARVLESRFSKAVILEFYLNQVPYAHRRRGVAQAAQFYFDRDLHTLNTKEILALAVLVRAPGRMDLVRDRQSIEAPVLRLANRLNDTNVLSPSQHRNVKEYELRVTSSELPADASHFVAHLKSRAPEPSIKGRMLTTLDATLQRQVRRILENRLGALRHRGVSDGAVIVVDHRHNEILAWVNAGDYNSQAHGSQIDAVTLPRQPGSTLKPFLYALALEKGWTAASLIDDTPLVRSVAGGLHQFHNYSRQYYGPIRLRNALGNSLNIPAIRTVEYVGRDKFLARLKQLGFNSLNRHPDHYGDGIGLGNGEVSLYELVRAYTVLANHGRRTTPRLLMNEDVPGSDDWTVYSPEVTSIIADILSDPSARQLEFGQGNLLRFPIQTAVKTGTSSDYRDAWAVGFSHRYTVGVWMGNLDQHPMKEITGSIGPGLVLRGVFAELNRFERSRPLYISRRLVAVNICPVSGLRARSHGPRAVEWFRPGYAPNESCKDHQHGSENTGVAQVEHVRDDIQFRQPTPNLQIASDPRIPDDREIFPFELAEGITPSRIEWILDGKVVGTTRNGDPYHWQIRRGEHVLQARVWPSTGKSSPVLTRQVTFNVQ